MGNSLVTTPVDADTNKKAVMASCGDDFTCVGFVDGRIKCFGRGSMRRLGFGNGKDIGGESDEMGTNLPFVDLFPTFAPTKTPSLSPTSNAPSKSPAYTSYIFATFVIISMNIIFTVG